VEDDQRVERKHTVLGDGERIDLDFGYVARNQALLRQVGETTQDIDNGAAVSRRKPAGTGKELHGRSLAEESFDVPVA
jgi:hypothetical protein